MSQINEIDGEAGADTINVNGGLNTDTLASLSATSEDIVIDSNVTTTGDQTYTGDTDISAGLAIVNGVDIDFDGGVDLGANTLRVIVTGTDGNVTGAISGTGVLQKRGTGTFTLDAAGTYSGGTELGQGTLQIGHADALGTGTVSINDVSSGAFDTALLAIFADAGNQIDNDIDIFNFGTGSTTIGTTSFNPGAVPTVFSGNIFVQRNTTFTGGNTDRTTYSGVISGNGIITVTGGARTTWEANNTFTNDVFITGAGTILQVGSGSGATTEQITNNANVDVGAGAALHLVFDNETIGGLTGTGTVSFFPGGGLGATTLTIGAGNASSTFNGTINNAGGTAFNLTKIGTGTQTISGNGGTINSASGLLQVNSGTLNVGGGFAGDGAWQGNVTVNGGTLRLTQSDIFNNGSDFTINASGQLDMNGQTDAIGNLQGDGNIINNSNTLNGIVLDDLNGTHTYTGDITGGGALKIRGNVANGGTQVFDGSTLDLNNFFIGRGTVDLNGGAVVTVPGTTIVRYCKYSTRNAKRKHTGKATGTS